jgi:hypothetical protein
MLFAARYEVLLDDLTSTHFGSSPPENPEDIRRFGCSRDKRSDWGQVVIALVFTLAGFPMACEVPAANTADKGTLGDFLQKSMPIKQRQSGSGAWTVASRLRKSRRKCVKIFRPCPSLSEAQRAPQSA